MWMTASTGATLRLIGDPAQHGAIAAGGMFRVICEHHERATPELVTTHRVQDPNDRAAAEALRDGRIDDALDHLQRAGHLHVVDDELEMYRDVLARWWDAHREGHDHPMVDRRNSTRRQLNRLAHAIRQVHGEVGHDEIIASDDRRFSVGDRVTARAPNRDLHPDGDPRAYVRNGALGTVTSISHGAHPTTTRSPSTSTASAPSTCPAASSTTTATRRAQRGRHRPRLRPHQLRRPGLHERRLHQPSRRDRHPSRDLRRHHPRPPRQPPLPHHRHRPPRRRSPPEAATRDRLQRSAVELTAWELAPRPGDSAIGGHLATGLQ